MPLRDQAKNRTNDTSNLNLVDQPPELIYPIPRRCDGVVDRPLDRRLCLQAEPVAVLRAGQRRFDARPVFDRLVDGWALCWFGSPHVCE